ncbi:Ldh family oxidoreductase [Alteribacillus sp. HJP-4]|uniref:Ldh family oxidoreductase n=1 Tax=Alteribacillus sp. HJP-4 TaxID=2775394 RepID=UPI0035CCD0FC
MKVYAESLKNFVADILQKVDISEENSRIVADSLVSANLRGVDSHGVTRVPIYVERLKSGAVNPDPNVTVLQESDATLLLDGDDGMGQIVGAKAIEKGIEKAKKHGAVYAGVTRSSHFGTGAYFIQKVLEQDMIAFAMSNAPSTMAPWGGITPYFGTNPYAYGIPAEKNSPIIFDMATSVVARGKIISAEQRGEDIPEGWAIDKEGRPTTNSGEALAGTVLPFGGPKGYAMAAMIDIMSGVLTGAGFGPHINNIYGDYDKPQNVGHFFQIIDIRSFMERDQFKQRVDQMINEIKNSAKAQDVEEIFLPGEIEFQNEKERTENGIELGSEVYESLKETAASCGISIEDYLR